MKKRSVLIILVAITLLSTILLSSILGVTKAEYFKKLSKVLDFEAGPDLALQYALWDMNGTDNNATAKTKEWEEGVYKNSKSFSQQIVVGRDKTYGEPKKTSGETTTDTNKVYYDAEWQKSYSWDTTKYPDAANLVKAADNFKYCGENIVYQIKLPVDETGYYVLNFQVDFRLKTSRTTGDPWASDTSDFFTQTYDRAIGCEILNYNDGFTFKDIKRLDLWSRSGNDTVYGESSKADDAHSNKQFLNADSLYQWKTLSPSRAENVSLAFKVEEGDVEKGYVLWMWDFAGLFGARTWKMEVTNLSVEKTMELNGSTKTRNSNVDPYFMFPQTSFVNNQHVLGLTNINDKADYDYRQAADSSGVLQNAVARSTQHRGAVSYSKGRGTFATSATANSLTFQAESLFFGFNKNTDAGKYDYMVESENTAYSNPVSLYIPLKNIQFNTDYKVTFDLSIARQGTYGLRTFYDGNPDLLNKNRFFGIDYNTNAYGSSLANYVDPTAYFTTQVNETDGDKTEKVTQPQNEFFRSGTHLFSSYLMSTSDPNIQNANRTEYSHTNQGFTQIKYANKTYQNEPLTKYDEINSLSSLQHSVTQSVNNTYNNAYHQNSASDLEKSQSRNWFNAVLHTEYNGQNEIHWVTFYNTTFSFNIDGSNENNKSKLTLDENGFIQDLNWVWAMDSLISGCYYRIKFENVRIEKVVKYTSSLDVNGVKIAGTRIDLTKHAVPFSETVLGYDTESDRYSTNVSTVDIFRAFRGINGTGQNWQAKGFVLDKGKRLEQKDTNQTFTADGNIYAPIIDATKFVVRPDDKSKSPDANGEYPPTADAYKIALSGFAVCEGGVEKYVYSIDGGLTWHDMTFSGGDADTGQLEDASRGVNQWTSGQTRYEKSDFATYSNSDVAEYTHLKNELFTETDGANANFSNFTLVADLSDYKNDANLDVIIAAVPTENINYRCEILRIINFNQIKNYVNFPYDFVSDITVNKDEGSSLLNAFRLDESHLADNQKPHYHNGLANPEAIGFTMTKIYSLREKRAQSTTAYARMGTSSYDYEDIKTAFSDFPIYNELSITGWAIVEGGVQNYYWSADHGKTWTKCSGTAVKYTNSTNNDLISPSYADHFYSELGREDSTIGKEKHRFEDSIDGAFNANTVEAKKNEFGTMLTADLSNYVGEVVDVIFAAKPNESDVYVPVGRIDNVAVYGENGTFYTRLHRVIIDQCILAGEENAQASEKYADTTYQFPDKTTWLSRVDNWDLGLNGYAYTIFEPNNVNVANTRLYHTEAAEIQSGGRVTIDGYVVCKGGVRQYKYSLDGGKTWTVINDAGANITANTKSPDKQNSTDSKTLPMITVAQKSDSSFTVADDGAKGDYCCYSSGTKLDPNGATDERTDYYNHAIEFNLPALPAGAERNLLVVAESTNNKLIPVLHIKLKFKYADGNTMQYGYHSSINRTDLTTLNAGYVSNEQNWSFTPPANATSNATTNNVLDRITIPIDPNTQPGEYQLNFTHRLKNEPQKVENSNRQMYTASGTTTDQTKAHIKLELEKTHYRVGEAIKVKYMFSKATNASGSGPGTASIAIVSEDWKNHSGNQHAVYYHNKIPFATSKTEYVIQDISEPSNRSGVAFSSNAGLPEHLKSGDLPAGTYSIYYTIRVDTIEKAKDDYAVKGIDRFVLAKFTIYIHDVDEEITFSAVHDEGEETYFSDISRQFVVGGTESNNKFDRQNELLYTLTKPFENNDERGISATVNITKEDIKRGYLILDVDYTKLLSKSRYPNNTCASPEAGNTSTFTKQYPGVNYNITIRFGQTPLVKKAENISNNVPFAGTSTGYGTTTMKIPVSAEGTYDLSFSGYLNNSVTHRGYDKGKTGWTDGYQLTLNYTGAAMSIPKTVYRVGEDIPVSYYAKGSVAATSPVKETGNLPWIGIFKHDTRTNPPTPEAIEAGRHYVQPDSSGVECISTADLEVGVYQIYLRDNSAVLFHGTPFRYWWEYDMVDPITVIITSAENPNTNTTFNYDFFNVPHIQTDNKTTGYTTGTLTLSKNVFYQGDSITITLPTKLSTSINFWFALCPEGSDSYVTWSYDEHTNLKTTGLSGAGKEQNSTTTGSYKIPPGKYTLYLLVGGDVATAHKNGRVYATMDITILPSTMKTAFGGATQIHSLGTNEQGKVIEITQDWTPTIVSDPFSYYTVSGTFTATQQDVERGYVMFEYDFTGLGSSVDLSFVIDKFTVTKRKSS